ncbi:hypothetical protein BJN42_23790 [Pseudomonas koreensis]|nr:hypothetical protein BJN42_23790 [Pseudomonas koreensis]
MKEAAHRFFVIGGKGAISTHQYLFILAQFSDLSRCANPCDNVKNIKTNGMQSAEIASIRASFVPLIAALGVSGNAANLGHFLLFQPQSVSFFAQEITRAYIREFTQRQIFQTLAPLQDK